MRRTAKRSLLSFTEYTNPAYEAAPHHALIADNLEAVARGEILRLMICMPPRHGKSELASRRFPAWYLGNHPNKQIIAASYNSDLANDFGREVRNIVSGIEFQKLFPVELAPDSKAANRWHTNAGGMYVAAGVGTAITGRGADILLIDDPFKDRAEADSENNRRAVWDWYTSTAYTRLMPGGAVIVINTRWHEDDLSGRLLAEQLIGGDQWALLSLPAIDTDNEPLWPEWYPKERLDQIKAVLPARDWNALYQQKPSPDEGTFFQKDWFQTWKVKPETLSIYGTSDFAVTDGSGDYTVHRVWGVDPAGNMYRLAGWRGQATSDVWVDRLIDLFTIWNPLAWFGEAGVIHRAIEPMLKRRMVERNVYCRMVWIPSIHDKATRARGFQSRAAMGRVYFESGADLDEFMRFPAGKHDDEIDCASLMGRALDDAHPAVMPIKDRPLAPDHRWDRAFRTSQGEDSWKTA